VQDGILEASCTDITPAVAAVPLKPERSAFKLLVACWSLR
jgi:hypothetical protein